MLVGKGDERVWLIGGVWLLIRVWPMGSSSMTGVPERDRGSTHGVGGAEHSVSLRGCIGITTGGCVVMGVTTAGESVAVGVAMIGET